MDKDEFKETYEKLAKERSCPICNKIISESLNDDSVTDGKFHKECVKIRNEIDSLKDEIIYDYSNNFLTNAENKKEKLQSLENKLKIKKNIKTEKNQEFNEIGNEFIKKQKNNPLFEELARGSEETFVKVYSQRFLDYLFQKSLPYKGGKYHLKYWEEIFELKYSYENIFGKKQNTKNNIFEKDHNKENPSFYFLEHEVDEMIKKLEIIKEKQKRLKESLKSKPELLDSEEFEYCTINPIFTKSLVEKIDFLKKNWAEFWQLLQRLPTSPELMLQKLRSGEDYWLILSHRLGKQLYKKLKPKYEIVFDPNTPYENCLLFNKILNNSKDHLYWQDDYIDVSSLEQLMFALDLDKSGIKKIKILTGGKNIKSLKEFKEFFEKIQKELIEKQEVSIELKIHPKNEFHNRFFISKENVYDTISKGYLFKKISSMSPLIEKESQDKIRGKWLKNWEDENALDIIKDWNEIKQKFGDSPNKKFTKSKYDYKCSKCGYKFSKSNKLHFDKPLCKKCLHSNNLKK